MITPFCFVWLFTAQALDGQLAHALEAHRAKSSGGESSEASRYTYTEHDHTINFDSKGKVTLDSTDTFDVIFLEGAPYKKHVLHDEKPLSEKDQRAEEKKIADVIKARRAENHHGLMHAQFRFEFPLDRINADFAVERAGQDAVDGRAATVYLAKWKAPDAAGLKEAARAGAAYEMKLWVDEQDGEFSRVEGNAVAEGMRFEKGTVVTMEWKKIGGEAWLPALFRYRGKVRYMMHDVDVESTQEYSGYQKFRVDTVIRVE